MVAFLVRHRALVAVGALVGVALGGIHGFGFPWT